MLNEEMIDKLIRRAQSAADNAYCPYSNYPVGAAVLTDGEAIYSGCNVECISFNAGLCAERVAVSSAIADGYTKFTAVAIFHDGEDLPFPCGTCRQFIAEFGLDTDIIVSNGETYEIVSLAGLLPHAFDTKEI